MFESDDGRHKDVHVVSIDFEGVVSEKFSDPGVGFRDLALSVLIAADHNDGSVLGKHQVKVVHVFFVLLHAHERCRQGHVLLALLSIVLNLREVAAVSVECLGVVGIYALELVPELSDLLRLVDDVESEFVQHIKINHHGVQV